MQGDPISHRILMVTLSALLFWSAGAASQTVAVAGNGSLTLALDARGKVTACRWPGPGGSNHVPDTGADSGPVPGEGLTWALRIGDQTYWLGSAPFQTESGIPFPSPVAHVRQQLLDPPLEVIQRVAVHPEFDVAILELTVLGPPAPPEVYWCANFSPVTRAAPEWHLIEPLLSPLDDFACFTDADRRAVFQFRPRNPGARDWSLADMLVRNNAALDRWDVFNDGVYLKCASPNPVLALQCGSERSETGPFAQVATGQPDGSTAAVGPCAFTIRLEPSSEAGVYRAAVVLAFGPDLKSVESLLPAGDAPITAGIFEQSETAWRSWLGQASGQAIPEAAQSGRYDILWTLYASRSRETGAMVRAAVSKPRAALDWPRFSVWTDAALDSAALHEASEQHLRFLASAVCQQAKPGTPAGALALALRPDGTEGVPHPVLDTGPAAWFLWGIWRHAGQLEKEPAKRDAFLASLAEPAMQCGRFLAEWEDPVSRLPRPTYDRTLGRDAQGEETLIEIRMGLACAMAITEATGHPMPEWRERTDVLDAFIRQQHTEADGSWKTGSPALLALCGTTPTDPAPTIEFLIARIEARDRRGYDDRLLQALVICEAATHLPASPGRGLLTDLLNREVAALQEMPEDPEMPPPPCDTALIALRSLVWELSVAESP